MKSLILALVLGAISICFATAPSASSLYTGGGNSDFVWSYDTTTGGLVDLFSTQTIDGDMTFGPDGLLYTGGSKSVWSYDTATGDLVDIFSTSNFIGDMTFGPDGLLYIGGSTSVWSYDTTTGDLAGLFNTQNSFGQMAFSPVPIPAAFWLFGSALGLLGWMRMEHHK